jgi:very-short-patch-repair endonuclease
MQRVPPELTEHARRLRQDATFEERLLWSMLRCHRPRFTRQLVVDRYIVDFACRSARIIIELDGGQHSLRIAEDDARSAQLRRHGWTVLRFWNNEVRDNVDGVAETIVSAVADRLGRTHPQPLPFREGGT